MHVSARIDIGEYLREYHQHGEILLRGKWAMDGAESLSEAAQLLRQFADELDELASAGFHLMGPIEDDHGFAHRGDEADLVTAPPPDRRDRRGHQMNEAGTVALVKRCASSGCASG
jgi:hypothetical protein